ncbi:MAG: nuclear transport factor 2 family protein [Actinomycetota bacterium]
MERAGIEAILDGLFGAAERQDWEAFAAYFAADATLSQNVGREQTLTESLRSLPAHLAGGTTIRYENVRRLIGDSHAAEFHDAVFTKPDGREVRIDICVAVQFGDDGLIVRSDEYLDSAAAAALFVD